MRHFLALGCFAALLYALLASESSAPVAQAQSAQQKSQRCPPDIDVVLGSAVIRLPQRVAVEGASREHLNDCSIKRVVGRSVYLGPGLLRSPHEFDDIGRPNRFQLYAVSNREGRIWPRGLYSVDQAGIDTILSTRGLPLDGGFYRSGANYVAPPEKYKTPTGDPYVVKCVEGAVRTECRVSYGIDERLHLFYWFNPAIVAQDNWLSLDQLMRRYVQSIRTD